MIVWQYIISSVLNPVKMETVLPINKFIDKNSTGYATHSTFECTLPIDSKYPSVGCAPFLRNLKGEFFLQRQECTHTTQIHLNINYATHIKSTYYQQHFQL